VRQMSETMETKSEGHAKKTTLVDRIRAIGGEPKHGLKGAMLRAKWKDEERREKLLLKPLADAARKTLKRLGINKSKDRPTGFTRAASYHSEGYVVEVEPHGSEPHVEVTLRGRYTAVFGEKPADIASRERMQARVEEVRAALAPLAHRIEVKGMEFRLYPFEDANGNVVVPEQPKVRKGAQKNG